MTHRLLISLALTAALLTSSASAQISIQPPARPAPAAAPVTTPTPAPSTLPSASSVLQNMLNSSATNPGADSALIAPPNNPVPGADGLLREGQTIELRSGRLKKDDTGGGGNMQFLFDPKETPSYPAMGVIPSRRLAAMEDAAGFGEGRTPTDMTFRITAEVTQYRGKNFLYIKPSGIPLPTPATVPAPTTATAPALANPVAPNAPAAAALPQGSIISNRVGRLVRDPKSGAKLIAFDADNKNMADPPMGVVPCKYLALLEDATEDASKPLPFRLSGEVLSYRGKNFLYLKMITRLTDLNQGIGAGTNLAH